jgi:hypothetical protein
MMLAEILSSLFPSGHDVVLEHGLLFGHGTRPQGRAIVIGVDGRAAVGVDEAAWLSRKILEALRAGGTDPILVLVDSDSQRMSKRDELLGLSEFLAHLAKCLIYADAQGHPTVGLLYGHTAAGAFIATALATRTPLALPGADPAVMDLPSMARHEAVDRGASGEGEEHTGVRPGPRQPGADGWCVPGARSSRLARCAVRGRTDGDSRRYPVAGVGHSRSAGEGTSWPSEGRRHCDACP